MSLFSSRYDNQAATHTRLFGRQRPLHSVLGGGIGADVLLWRNKNISAAILIMVTVTWFLFEVVKYHFLTLLCHIFIITLLAVFVWSNLAVLFDWTPPKIPEIILSESKFNKVALSFHKELVWLFSSLYDIACGRESAVFILTIASLWILSVIGKYFSTINLLYFGFLCMLTLPVLYEQYEDEVDYLISKRNQDMKKLYERFDSSVLKRTS